MNLASAAQPRFVSSAAAGEGGGGGAGVVFCRDLIIRDNVICRQGGNSQTFIICPPRVHRHAVPPAGCWLNGAESRHQN